MPKARELDELPFAEFLEPLQGPFEPDTRYETVHVHGAELAEPVATGVRMLEVALSSTTFEGGTLRHAHLREVWMQAVRWIGTDLSATDWLDVEISGSVLAGVPLFDAKLRRVMVFASKADSVNLRGSHLQDVTFVECQLEHVDFGGAKLENVSFPGTRLIEARFDGAQLSKVDFRDASELGVAGSLQGLKGGKITTGQLMSLAPQFAQEYGISVTTG